MLQERHYDHESGRIDVEWTFIRDGAASTSHSSVRLYTYQELRGLLLAAGFASVAGYDSDGEPFRVPDSRRLVAVASA